MTSTTYLAQPTEEGGDSGGNDLDFDVSGLQDIVLEVLGSFAVTALAVFLTIYWVQSNFGRMVTIIFAALGALYFIWFPDNAKSTLEAILTTVTPA